MSPVAEFPPTLELNGRKFCARSQLEHLKQTLIAQAMGATPPEYAAPAVEEFVPLAQVAKELGVSRRTIGRRIAIPKPVAPSDRRDTGSGASE